MRRKRLLAGPPTERDREGSLLRPRRRQDRYRGGDQEDLSQARQEAASGHESGRQEGGGALQGSVGGLRDPGRSEKARSLRRIRRDRDAVRLRRDEGEAGEGLARAGGSRRGL